MKKIKEGSMTIEATVIVPLCFVCMIVLLYVGMYLHDRYVIETTIQTVAQREMRYLLQEELVETGQIDWGYWSEKTLIWPLVADFEEEMQQCKQRIVLALETKLLLSTIPNVELEMDAGEIYILYESQVTWSMAFLSKWMNGTKEATIKGEVRVIGIEAQDWIRMCRGLLTL